MAASWVKQNPRLTVLFDGWESDTYLLGRHGWEVATHEDYRQRDMIFVFRHQRNRIVAHGRLPDFYQVKASAMLRDFVDPRSLPPIRIDSMQFEGGIVIHGGFAPYEMLRQVETRPTSIALERFLLDSIPMFAEKGRSEAQEIIVDPDEVGMWLDKILKAQSPGMREIRSRDDRRARDAPETKQVHAQIISLKAA